MDECADWENLSPEETDADVERLFDEAFENSYSDLIALRPRMLIAGRKERRGFERRLRTRYRRAFDLFDHFLIACHDVGRDVNKEYRPRATQEENFAFLTLTRIHARACLVSSEVRALIFSGHASGALTRWRTLHELTVIAWFINEHGNEAAERYVNHQSIKTYREALKYQKYAERLGLEPLESPLVDEIAAARRALVDRYGQSYDEEWGWAAEFFPGKPKRPKFTDLEKSLGMDHWRPYVGASNHAVHGGINGMIFDPGYGGFDQDRIMLSGPSNAGLIVPADSTLLDLCSCTTALLTIRPDPETVTQMRVLQRYLEDCRQAFFDANKRLEEDELRYGQDQGVLAEL